MKLRFGRITIEFDYATAAAVCAAVILSRNASVLAAMVFTVLHEAGHIAVMQSRSKGDVEIKADLFNVVIKDPVRGVRGYREDAAIICAGPLVNITLWAALYVLYRITGYEWAYTCSMINAALGVFNLLPIETTDGGQLMRIFLYKRLQPNTADRVMLVLSVLLILPIACAGFCMLLDSRYNYTMLTAAMYLIAAIISKNV